MAMACSSGTDFADAARLGATNSSGQPIPYEIRSSFKYIPGGLLNRPGVPEVPSLFTGDEEFVAFFGTAAEAEADAAATSSVAISSFEMMDTEVTIQMFADYLNSLNDIFEGSEVFDDPENIYKPVMHLTNLCGLYKRDSSGLSIVEEVSQIYSQTYDEVTFTLGKPGLGKPKSYIDPFSSIQKARMAGGSCTYEAAPGRGNHPMAFVSKLEALDFARWLGIGNRLPTIEEFHYAAKGGGNVDFGTSSGDLFDDVDPVTGDPIYLANVQGVYAEGNGLEPVKSYPSNPYGLFDMTGNLWEWTGSPEDLNVLETGESSSLVYYPVPVGGSYLTTEISKVSTWYFRWLWVKEITDTSVSVLYRNLENWSADVGFRVLYSNTIQGELALPPPNFFTDDTNDQPEQ